MLLPRRLLSSGLSASAVLVRTSSTNSSPVTMPPSTEPKFTLRSQPAYEPSKDPGGARPSHHIDATKTKFRNPWPSFREAGGMEMAKLVLSGEMKASPMPSPEEVKRLVPVRAPGWGAEEKGDGIKATWLGHASFFIEFPAEEGATRGLRVLTDPVLSNRCSPSQLVGPARFTPAPCTAEEIPEFDVLVISHNHYDHLDLPTITRLASRSPRPHVFLPLNTARILKGTGFELSGMTELDWWETAEIGVKIDGQKGETGLRVTGTPTQHFTSRHLFDKGASLWNSFALSTVPSTGSTTKSSSLFFTGDTAYSALPADAPRSSPTPANYLPDRPVCPAFKEIGEHFGGFDLALVPIGAYEPRGFMSTVHCDPFEAVQIFKDVKAKRAIGMHWGVWRLTTEPIDEPPRLLAQAREQFGVQVDEFHTLEIGETRSYKS